MSAPRFRAVAQVVVLHPGSSVRDPVILAVCTDGTMWTGIYMPGDDVEWDQLNGPPLTIKGPAKPVVRPDVLVGPKRDLSTLPPEALVPTEVPK